jgi:hypothetical protein
MQNEECRLQNADSQTQMPETRNPDHQTPCPQGAHRFSPFSHGFFHRLLSVFHRFYRFCKLLTLSHPNT